MDGTLGARMSGTRRAFLQSTATLATGLAGARSAVSAQGTGGPNPLDSVPDSEIIVPKVKFGKVEISRLVVGCNPFVGSGHGNETWATTMRDGTLPLGWLRFSSDARSTVSMPITICRGTAHRPIGSDIWPQAAGCTW